MQRLFSTLLRAILVLLITLLMVELLLQLAFNSLPDAIKQRMPQAPIRYGIQFDTPHGAREYPAFEEVDLTISGYSGDLYALTCLSPVDAPDVDSYQVHYRRDAHGFRNTEPWPQDTSIIFVGDSFTAAESVQHSYWEGIAENNLVLALPGSGTLEQSLLLDAYGLNNSPEVVVLAYFGGNDISDTARFDAVRSSGENMYDAANKNRSPWEYLVTFQIVMFIRDSLGSSKTTNDCPYPVVDSQGTPLAFYAAFFDNGLLDTGDLAANQDYLTTQESIINTAERVKNAGAQFVLMYIPYKAEVHWGLLNGEQRAAVASQITASQLEAARLQPTTPATIANHLTSTLAAQRLLLQDVAEANNFLFLDLTPGFQNAAAEGENNYFFSDTHWNQNGHDLAKRLLTDFLIDNDLLPQP